MVVGSSEIIPASERHLPFLSAIETAAAALLPPGSLPSGIENDALPPEKLRKGLEDKRLWVAVVDGKAVGFSLLEVVDGFHLLAEIDVLPEYGRRGLGTLLVQQAIRRAKGEGGAFLYLTTFASIPWNGPFYARLGFVQVPEEDAPPFISGILAAERAAGFADRVAMRLPL